MSRVGLDHRMQGEVPGGVLHDQERRLCVGDVIVAALADRDALDTGRRSGRAPGAAAAGWPRPRSLMPSCLRTVLAPPSQPTRYCAVISESAPPLR